MDNKKQFYHCYWHYLQICLVSYTLTLFGIMVYLDGLGHILGIMIMRAAQGLRLLDMQPASSSSLISSSTHFWYFNDMG